MHGIGRLDGVGGTGDGGDKSPIRARRIAGDVSLDGLEDGARGFQNSVWLDRVDHHVPTGIPRSDTEIGQPFGGVPEQSPIGRGRARHDRVENHAQIVNVGRAAAGRD